MARIDLIIGLVRALVRYRLDDRACLLPVEQIDAETTNDDRAFVLRLLRTAAPLYPLPEMTVPP